MKRAVQGAVPAILDACHTSVTVTPTGESRQLDAQSPAFDNPGASTESLSGLVSSAATFAPPASEADNGDISTTAVMTPKQLAERLRAIPLVRETCATFILNLNLNSGAPDTDTVLLALLNSISLLFMAFQPAGTRNAEVVCWLRNGSTQRPLNHCSIVSELPMLVAELRLQLPVELLPLLDDVLVELVPTFNSSSTVPSAHYSNFHYSTHVSLAHRSLRSCEPDQSKLESLMLDLRRHRPDQVVVRGFSLQDQQVVLGSANACGFWSDETCPADDLEVWVRHMCAVYHSLAYERVPGLRLHDVLDDVPVYCLTVPERAEATQTEDIFLIPFFIRRPPGRTTFVGSILNIEGHDPSMEMLRTAYDTRECTGVVKIAWPLAKDHKRETEWYATAHKDDWIPGLAQHRTTSVTHVQVFNPLNPDEARVLDVTILDSVGVPLSQCETPRELLEVISAVALTAERMTVADVMLRDYSATNILCRSRHDPRSAVPNRGSNPMATYSSSLDCCLVIDLDYASSVDGPRLQAEQSKVTEHVGTAMFMADEMLHRADNNRMVWHSFGSLHNLLAVLGLNSPRVLTTDRITLAMFPPLPEASLPAAATSDSYANLHCDDAWRNALRELDATAQALLNDPSTEAYAEGIFVTETVPHRPRHDAHSIFRVLVWMLARAWPIDSPPASSLAYISFVHSALQEDGTSDRRSDVHNFAYILHPRLAALQPLLDAMHRYLCGVPWAPLESVYSDTGRVFPLHPAHAFVALRKIITWFLAYFDTAVLDVPLRTDRPRPVPLDRFDTLEVSESQISVPSSSSSDRKRKAEACDDPRPTKRQAGAEKGATNMGVRHMRHDDIPLTTPKGVAALALRHKRWFEVGVEL